MELTEQQRAACAAMEDSWYWQVQERGKWRYRWHNEVMVRYYECAPLEADVFPAMIEYLQGQTGITSIQLHGKRIELGGEWKAVRAWYETRDGDTSETNKLKRVRICQALVKNAVEAGGDGPYLVENGCMYNRGILCSCSDTAIIPALMLDLNFPAYTFAGTVTIGK